MDDSKSQLLAQLRDATNVLVTVTKNPSVDQLAGAIGLTLLLNKLGKHATAIFSGQTPDVLEFLKPGETLEKNTDSLRDFIVALDKAKADKLRYKVEDSMVRIFITPHHTALTEKDLEFSQGDYNVDLVVALGAHEQKDLDQAIVAHGRILHDATVSSINIEPVGAMGTINWVDHSASCLCEMIFDLIQQLQPEGGLDPQMATALLTGIVSETRRFGNDKTTAKSLETSSLLVAAGANQQLVAAKLEEKPAPIPEKKAVPRAPSTHAAPDLNKPGATDTHKDPEAIPQTAGTVMITHDEDKPAPADGEEIHIDEEGKLHAGDTLPEPVVTTPEPEADQPGTALDNPGPKFVSQPPSLGSPLSGGSGAPQDTVVDPLSNTVADNAMPLLSHDSGPALHADAPHADPHAAKTLSAIEQSVTGSHMPPDVDEARNAVDSAANAMPDFLPKPSAALNAQPIDLTPPTPVAMPSMSFTAPSTDPTSPPPVPPPMTPPSFALNGSPQAPTDQQNTSNSL